jgi:hypothetical protein
LVNTGSTFHANKFHPRLSSNAEYSPAGEQASGAQTGGASAGRYGPQRAAVLKYADDPSSGDQRSCNADVPSRPQKGTRGKSPFGRNNTNLVLCFGFRDFIRLSDTASTPIPAAPARLPVKTGRGYRTLAVTSRRERRRVFLRVARWVPLQLVQEENCTTPNGKMSEVIHGRASSTESPPSDSMSPIR